MTNGEKVTRDWLVWSISRQSLFCFLCCLFLERSQKEVRSKTFKLTKPDLGHGDNWRKLYGKVEAHQRSSSHVSCFITWKELEKPYLEQLELISNFNRSSKAKYQNGLKYFDAYWTLYCFCRSDNFPFADQPLN